MVDHSLIEELMLYNFEQGPSTVEATKNIYYVKGESAVITVQKSDGSRNFTWVAKP